MILSSQFTQVSRLTLGKGYAIRNAPNLGQSRQTWIPSRHQRIEATNHASITKAKHGSHMKTQNDDDYACSYYCMLRQAAFWVVTPMQSPNPHTWKRCHGLTHNGMLPRWVMHTRLCKTGETMKCLSSRHICLYTHFCSQKSRPERNWQFHINTAAWRHPILYTQGKWTSPRHVAQYGNLYK